MNISLRPSLLLLVLTGNPTFQNFRDGGAKGVHASLHATGMTSNDAEPIHQDSDRKLQRTRAWKRHEEGRSTGSISTADEDAVVYGCVGRAGYLRVTDGPNECVPTETPLLLNVPSSGFEEWTERVQELERNNAVLDQRLQESESCNAELMANNTQLVEHAKSLDDKFDGLEGNTTQLRTDVDELETLSDQVKAMQASNETWSDQVEALQASNETLSDQVEALQASNEILSGQVEELQASNTTSSKRLEDLESCACIPKCTTLESDDPVGLRGAIVAMVDAGDTRLTLCPNTTVTWNTLDPLTNNDIPSRFTLQCSPGAGESERCILDGGGLSQFFLSDTEESNWTFRGITFINGFSSIISGDGRGGAFVIKGQGSKLMIDACHFDNNKAGRHGGAVDVVGADKVTIQNSTFKNNEADFRGGAATLFNVAVFVVKDCEFLQNRAVSGGALFVGLGSADFTPGGNLFRNNSATQGGAIRVAGSSANLCSESSDHANMFDGNGNGTGGFEDYCLNSGGISIPSAGNCTACEEITAVRQLPCGVVPCQFR